MMKDAELQLNIISPEKKLFSGMVTSVVIPGISGLFGVYANHAPMVSPMQAGTITYTVGGKETTLDVNGGVAEVNQNIVIICIT